MRKEAHDIVIIGAGIMGLALAYNLAKAGQDVCIVEKGVVGRESSGRCGGIIGQSNRQSHGLPLAMLSVKLWKTLAQEPVPDFEFRQNGTMSLIWDETNIAEMKAMMEQDRTGGLTSYYLDRAETKRRVPYITDTYLRSVYCPSNSSAEPYKACLNLANLAKRHGAMIYEHREVQGIEVADGRAVGVLSSAGRISAGIVVNAAGAWAEPLSRAVGVPIPAVAKRSHIIVTQQVPHFIDPSISTDIYGYFRQTLSGNVLLGYPAQSVAGYNKRVTYDAMRITAQRTATLIPSLRKVPIIRAFTGFTTWTPDLMPVIGPTRLLERYYVAAAFCGRGFGIGPALGQLLAEHIINGESSLPLDAYSPDRFDRQLDQSGS